MKEAAINQKIALRRWVRGTTKRKGPTEMSFRDDPGILRRKLTTAFLTIAYEKRVNLFEKLKLIRKFVSRVCI